MQFGKKWDFKILFDNQDKTSTRPLFTQHFSVNPNFLRVYQTTGFYILYLFFRSKTYEL